MLCAMPEVPYVAEVDGQPSELARRDSSAGRNTGTLAGDNSLVPACNLPAEILSMVFLILPKMPCMSDSKTSDSQHTPAPQWVVVTHVCRTWRAVALDSTALWTTLPLLSPAYTRLALTRTNNAPIFIKKRICGERDAKTVQELLLVRPDLLGRVGLEFTWPPELRRQNRCVCLSVLETLLQSLQKSTGVLETLSLKSHSEDAHPLPTFLQRGGIPALKEVVLQNFVISWANVPLPSSLTRLSLHANTYVARQASTWQRVLGSLDATPLLEDLELCCVLPLVSPNAGEREHSFRPPVGFQLLKRLMIRDMLGPIVTLLEYILLPETTFLHIYIHAVDDMSQQCTTKIGCLLSKIRSVSPGYRRPLHHLKYGSPHDLLDSSEVNTSQKFVLRFEAAAAGLTGPTLQISLSPVDLPLQGLLDEFNRRLDLTTLVSTEVLDNKYLPLSAWVSTLEHCEALKEITLKQFYRSFMRALSTMSLRNHRMPWLPSLTTLRLEFVCFKKEDEVLSSLLEVLRERSAAGYPLLELTVDTGKCCNFSHYYRRLQDVPNLVVNWIRDPEAASGLEGDSEEEDKHAKASDRYEGEWALV